MSEAFSTGASRRAFLALAGAALTAPAVHGVALAQTVPTRRSAHDLSNSDRVVRSLRNAISALRQRDVPMPRNLAHPGGWRQAAQYHAQICGPSARAGAAAMDPQNEVHGGWWFLPWHRAYLAALERLLRQAADDQTLALPYWDIHANPSVPPIYQGDPATNPLAHAQRQVGAFTASPLPFFSGSPQTERQAVRSAAFSDFAGARPGTGGVFRPGQIELEAHNQGHMYIGGDMGDFATAGFDPLFYAHHANIDRLWEVWRNAGGTTRRANPTDAVWGARRFAFQNQNGGVWLVATRDLADTQQITFLEFGLNGARNVAAGYTYDRTRPAAGGLAGVASASAESGAAPIVLPLSGEGEKKLGAEPMTLSLAGAAPESGLAPSGGGLAAPASAARGGAALTVDLKGLSLPQGPLKLILEARRSVGGERLPVAERILMPFTPQEQAESARMDVSLDVAPDVAQDMLKPGAGAFLLRVESPSGQTLTFEGAELRVN